MNRYQPPLHRPLFAIAAVAMTAVTLAVSVIVPSSLAPANQEAITVAAAKRASSVTEVAISPARIEVIGLRQTNVADSPARDVSKPKQRG